MPRLLDVFFVLACAALAGALAGIVLLLLKRPALAHRVAKRATLGALVVLLFLGVELYLLWSAPRLMVPLLAGVASDDPGSMAMELALSISAIFNGAAVAVAALWLGGTAWFMARLQLKRLSAKAPPQGGS